MDVTVKVVSRLEPFDQVHDTRRLGWQTVAADPEPFLSVGLADGRWLAAALPRLIAGEARCPTAGACTSRPWLRLQRLCATSTRRPTRSARPSTATDCSTPWTLAM